MSDESNAEEGISTGFSIALASTEDFAGSAAARAAEA
jgi:hypothetical protein